MRPGFSSAYRLPSAATGRWDVGMVDRDPRVPDSASEHVNINRAYWDDRAGANGDAGRRAWGAAEPTWGIWGIPQSQLPVIPDDVAGKDVIELGCGTGGTCRRGWRGAVLGRRASTTHRNRWRRLGTCSVSMDWSSHCTSATPSARRSLTPRSTWRSVSTVLRSGATHTAGSPRRHGCSALTGA